MPNEVTPTQADIAMADEIAEWDWHIGTVYTLRHYLASHRIAHEAPLLARNAELRDVLEQILQNSCVGKAGQMVVARSKYANYPAHLYHAARAALATKDTPSHDA